MEHPGHFVTDFDDNIFGDREGIVRIWFSVLRLQNLAENHGVKTLMVHAVLAGDVACCSIDFNRLFFEPVNWDHLDNFSIVPVVGVCNHCLVGERVLAYGAGTVTIVGLGVRK